MKREQLKEWGLTDEQIEKVMAENGRDIEKHKAAAEEAQAAADGLTEQIKGRDGQLKELQKSAGDNAELKAQIEALQKANTEQKEAFDKQLAEQRFQAALNTELLKADALDNDLVNVKLDKSKLKLNDDGTLTGLAKQLAALKESHGFLFKQPQSTTTLTGAAPAGGTSTPTGGKKVEEMTYSEMMNYLKANPDAKI